MPSMGWYTLHRHDSFDGRPERHAISYEANAEHPEGVIYVSAKITDKGDCKGYLRVYVRREDAAPERRWACVMQDAENRTLVTGYADAKERARADADRKLAQLGYTKRGWADGSGD